MTEHVVNAQLYCLHGAWPDCGRYAAIRNVTAVPLLPLFADLAGSQVATNHARRQTEVDFNWGFSELILQRDSFGLIYCAEETRQ